MYLPAVEREEVVPAPKPATPQTLDGTECLLLCEDDEAIRRTMRIVLDSHGYTVLEAAQPREALEIAEREESLDLLVTDVILPEKNGLILAGEISASHPSTPVLFISGYARNVIVHNGVVDEGIHFLEKPFTPAQLLEKVRSILDQGDRSDKATAS